MSIASRASIDLALQLRHTTRRLPGQLLAPYRCITSMRSCSCTIALDPDLHLELIMRAAQR